MSPRELIVLGTASQVPTRQRGHNGYLLRWDGEGILFDPGEGAQRQMLLAGVAATDITRICLTHLHGDHALGLPGVIQRLSLDGVPHPVPVHFPASGAEYLARLRHATPFHETAELREEPITAEGVVAGGDPDPGTADATAASAGGDVRGRTRGGTATGTSPDTRGDARARPGEVATGGPGSVARLEVRRLSHTIDAYGYRLVEPDGRRMLPERLSAYGIAGPAIGELQRVGHLDLDGRRVALAEVSTPRRGQRFAFVMDTRLCDGVYELADGADMLVAESTFLESDTALATAYGHLTAAQAARVAQDCGVRRLVLTHFSQRYPDPAEFEQEARRHFDGDLVIAEDLTRVPVPPRR